jgi:TRAP-type transport system small permease protein
VNATLSAIRRAFELLVALLFAAMVIVFAANIFGRFALNRPIIWADEVLVYLMIWCTFLSVAFVVREREHVAFDLVHEAMAPERRRYTLAIGALVTAAIFAWAAPKMIDYIRFLWRERTNILEVRLDIAYSVFGAFVAMLIASRLRMAFRLLGPSWRGELDAIEGKDKPSASNSEAGKP